eukprot:3866527-Rhodomonas_salina.1
MVVARAAEIGGDRTARYRYGVGPRECVLEPAMIGPSSAWQSCTQHRERSAELNTCNTLQLKTPQNTLRYSMRRSSLGQARQSAIQALTSSLFHARVPAFAPNTREQVCSPDSSLLSSRASHAGVGPDG